MKSLTGILVFILVVPFLATASPLGLAGAYNEFVFGDIDLRSTDSFGGVAAGGNVYFENVSVASKVAPPLATGDLLVGNDLFFDAGSVGFFPDERILYNFYEADFLEIASIEVHGSVLAPRADVLFYNGHIEGNLIARLLAGDSTGVYTGGEARDEYFEGELPYEPVPEPGTIFLAGGGLLLLALVGRCRWVDLSV